MGDEPRRSGRPTKGVHTKMDLADTPASGKKKGGKRGKKQAVEAEDEICRCVCGANVDDHNGDAWIACDNCGVWQHNVCVGISTFDEDLPEHYKCEECDPIFHRPLLDAIARGEKPWEDRKLEHQKKKKGKKGKKRLSDEATNGKANSPSTPVPETKKANTPAAKGSTKRKARDESHDKDSAKVQKVSAAHVTPKQNSPPSGLPTTILELPIDRQKTASLFLKTLNITVPTAVKNGIYTLDPEDSIKAKAERLAVQIEDAIKRNQQSGTYGTQCRTVAANLKTNQELCNGLLTKTLSPDALATMTSDDMASKEQKQKAAVMKAKADKASIMITEDDGPRIRRTHKGDEVIEGDNGNVMDGIPISSRQRRRSMMDPNGDMASRSRENSPGNDVELPANINDYRSQDDIRAHVPPTAPLSIDTKATLKKKGSKKDFNFNQILSHVPQQSPTGPSHNRRPSGVVQPSAGPEEDPEIDRLLQDDGIESPPYSPAEHDADPEIIWKGMVNMDSIAKFPAFAKLVGGADLTRTANPIPWSDILQKDLRVAGRIDQDKANEYLCSLRYSPPTDVVVVNLTPTGESSESGFKDMYDYFHDKHRYGVLTNKGVGNIRDTYLVPVPPSPANFPDFIVNLEGHKVPEVRKGPMILVALVIRTQYDDFSYQQYDSPANARSPSMPNHPVPARQLSISGAGPAMSPIAPQNGSFQPPSASSQSPHPQPQLSPEDLQRRQDQERAQRQGEETARTILGTYAQAPTVGFLMPQAFQMRALEWEVIRGILETDDKARIDLQHLSQVLEVRMAQQSQLPQTQGTPQAPPQAHSQASPPVGAGPPV